MVIITYRNKIYEYKLNECIPHPFESFSRQENEASFFGFMFTESNSGGQQRLTLNWKVETFPFRNEEEL